MRAPELEARMVGALLAAADPMRLLQLAGAHPETFGDGMLRACWGIAIDLARQGKKVNAYAVHSIGRQTKALKDDDLGVLETLQARNAIDEQTFVQIAQDLRRVAHSRALGQQLVELGKEVGNAVDPGRSLARFDALREHYMRLHAGVGRRGSQVVQQHFAEFDERRARGRVNWVTSGIALIDEQTGGLPPKLGMVLGPPGVMKTGLAVSMLEGQCLAGVKPLVFAFEDGTSWVVKRPLAKRLQLRVRDVFAKDFPDEERAAVAGQELSTLFENAWFCTKDHARSADDVVRIATQLVAQQGIDCVWVDNARAVRCEPRPRTGETKRDAISRMYETFAEWADRFRIPLVLLAHTTRKYEERTRGKGPPVMSDIGETSDAEKDVRYLLALWQKGNQLRVTVGKHTEGEPGATFQFAKLTEAAMVDPESGELIDVRSEDAKERREASERRDEIAVAQAARRKELREKLAAANKPPEPTKVEEPKASPQLELIPGGAGEKPEEPKP